MHHRSKRCTPIQVGGCFAPRFLPHHIQPTRQGEQRSWRSPSRLRHLSHWGAPPRALTPHSTNNNATHPIAGVLRCIQATAVVVASSSNTKPLTHLLLIIHIISESRTTMRRKRLQAAARASYITAELQPQCTTCLTVHEEELYRRWAPQQNTPATVDCIYLQSRAYATTAPTSRVRADRTTPPPDRIPNTYHTFTDNRTPAQTQLHHCPPLPCPAKPTTSGVANPRHWPSRLLYAWCLSQLATARRMPLHHSHWLR